MGLILSDSMLDELVTDFLKEMNMPAPKFWDTDIEKKQLEKCKIALIKSLHKMYTIRPSFGSSAALIRKTLNMEP